MFTEVEEFGRYRTELREKSVTEELRRMIESWEDGKIMLTGG